MLNIENCKLRIEFKYYETYSYIINICKEMHNITMLDRKTNSLGKISLIAYI